MTFTAMHSDQLNTVRPELNILEFISDPVIDRLQNVLHATLDSV